MVNKQAKTLFLLTCVGQIMRYGQSEKGSDIFHELMCQKGRNDPRVIELARSEFIPHDPDIIFPCIEQQREICDLVLW